MTTPQEPTERRIVPFRPAPRHPRRPSSPPPIPHRSTTCSPIGCWTVSTVVDPLPGEADGVHHLRAVQLGASSGAFYPHTPTELVPQAAARLGIRAIEIMLQTRGEYEPAFIAGVAANARAAGVKVTSVHSLTRLHPFLDAYPRRVKEAHDAFQLAIEATVALGAQVLVWHGPNRTELRDDEAWERFIVLTAGLARRCGEAGITLGIENVSYGALALVRNVVSFATRLHEIGGQREIGFVFDPFQAAEAGANPFMMLAAMGNRVVNVHISDVQEHDPGARHLLPGDGDLPWSALIRAIAGSGYTGPMMIEGPLGTDATGIARVRQSIEPLIRSVFSFPPDARRNEEARHPGGPAGRCAEGDRAVQPARVLRPARGNRGGVARRARPGAPAVSGPAPDRGRLPSCAERELSGARWPCSATASPRRPGSSRRPSGSTPPRWWRRARPAWSVSASSVPAGSRGSTAPRFPRSGSSPPDPVTARFPSHTM